MRFEEWHKDETAHLKDLGDTAAENAFGAIYFSGKKGLAMRSGFGFDREWNYAAIVELIRLGLIYAARTPKGVLRLYSTVPEEPHPVSPNDIYRERKTARGN